MSSRTERIDGLVFSFIYSLLAAWNLASWIHICDYSSIYSLHEESMKILMLPFLHQVHSQKLCFVQEM